MNPRILYFELLAILSVSCLIFFHDLGEGSLMTWDEALHAQIAKEMVLTGNWLTLSYKFMPYCEVKTPLLIWLTALNYSLVGFTTLATRSWPAVFGVGTAVVTFLLARELFNHRVGVIASTVLVSAPLFVGYSRLLMMDVPLTFFIVAALYCFLLARKNRGFYILAGISSGFAVLTKSAAGFIPLLTIGIYSTVSGKTGHVSRKNAFTVLIIFLLTAAPWFLYTTFKYKTPCMRFFFGQLFRRFDPEYTKHQKGDMFNVRLVSEGLAHWSGLLLFSIPYIMYKASLEKKMRLIVVWIALVSFFLIISNVKLPWYPIPLFPALAITIGCFLDSLKLRRLPIGLFAASAVFLVSVCLPEPSHCNDLLQAINEASKGELKVHSSVGRGPAELFYLGVRRYSDETLLAEGGQYILTNGSPPKDLGGFARAYTVNAASPENTSYALFVREDLLGVLDLPSFRTVEGGFC